MKVKSKHILKEFGEGEDGYWIILVNGWKWAGDPVGCIHAIHEDTKAQAYREHVLPCTCKDCGIAERK